MIARQCSYLPSFPKYKMGLAYYVRLIFTKSFHMSLFFTIFLFTDSVRRIEHMFWKAKIRRLTRYRESYHRITSIAKKLNQSHNTGASANPSSSNLHSPYNYYD